MILYFNAYIYGQTELHHAGINQAVRVMEELVAHAEAWKKELSTVDQLLQLCLDHPCTKASPLHSRLLWVLFKVAPYMSSPFKEFSRWGLDNLMEEDLLPNPGYGEYKSLFDHIDEVIGRKVVILFAEAEQIGPAGNKKHFTRAKWMFHRYREAKTLGNFEEASAALILMQRPFDEVFGNSIKWRL